MNQFKNLEPIDNWFPDIDKLPLLISGPCSAESREQVLKTAIELSKIPLVKIFRAGIWKPRTRPGSFEGVGEKGLKWLTEARERTGLKIAVEIASPYHFDLISKYNIDMVWIGARTISNPFSVQEIANRMKGSELPVLIKNPINPDLELWIGALERFYNTGIRKIAAVHRGFYPFEQTSLRNIPKWEIPIELETRINNLPVFCDPSHIAGNREDIGEISQKALDLNMSGLMIESHINPDKALSDAQQQITPKQLEKILENLVFRSIKSNDKIFLDIMDALRQKIDSIDEQIIELLAKRMNIVEEIAKYKSKNKVTIFQLRRWEKIISSRISQGANLGLSKSFIKDLLQLVHKESIAKQAKIMRKLDKESKNNN